jgi:putative spermidine/putrescine transport system permease protein
LTDLTSVDGNRAEADRFGSAARRRQRRRRNLLSTVGIAPFFVFVALFLVVPAGSVMVEAFRANTGGLSLSNISEILNSSQPYLQDYISSLELSAVSAALVGSPNRVFRRLVSSACGVLANTGGVPLAFAFIGTVGNTGIVTSLLSHLGFNPYDHGFTLYSASGLVIVYLYFLLPLTVLLMLPPVEALRREWREAAATLGADARTFWLKVGLPVLAPPVVATFMVLFMDAFAAYATAEVLTTGVVPLVPLAIGQLLQGNVVANEVHLGDALGFGMVIVVGVAGALYVIVQRRTSRWLR